MSVPELLMLPSCHLVRARLLDTNYHLSSCPLRRDAEAGTNRSPLGVERGLRWGHRSGVAESTQHHTSLELDTKIRDHGDGPY